MSTALDMTSVIEREADKAVVCQTAGIKRASVQKRKEDKETMLRTEGLNIQASSLLVIVIICFLLVIVIICFFLCLQCFDTVGWAAGRASGL